jgi:hypothetical protein
MLLRIAIFASAVAAEAVDLTSSSFRRVGLSRAVFDVNLSRATRSVQN